MPKYSEVDWTQAECAGIYGDLFYMVEEERNIEAYAYINAVRSICAKCPIWAACLTYGFSYEQYGVWGGLTSIERRSFADPTIYPAQRQRALRYLAPLGITQIMIKEAYEHSLNERSLENEFADNGEDGVISYC